MSYRNNEENAITENGELSKSMETDWTQIQTPKQQMECYR